MTKLLPCPFCGSIPACERTGTGRHSCIDSGESWNVRTAPSGAEPADFNLRDADLAALLPGTYYMDPPDGGDVSLFEQLRRMSMDAAKWRRSAERPSGAELPALTEALESQEFHERCMDYRGASPYNANDAFIALQQFILAASSRSPSGTES